MSAMACRISRSSSRVVARMRAGAAIVGGPFQVWCAALMPSAAQCSPTPLPSRLQQTLVPTEHTLVPSEHALVRTEHTLVPSEYALVRTEHTLVLTERALIPHSPALRVACRCTQKALSGQGR